MGKWSKKVLEKTGFRETKITFYCLKSFWNESGIKKKNEVMVKEGRGETEEEENERQGTGSYLLGSILNHWFLFPTGKRGFPCCYACG